MSGNNDQVQKRTRGKRKAPRTANDSAQQAGSPTMKQGELFESMILSESRQPEKSTRVAEAMREEGFDERALARAFIKLLQKQMESAEGIANDKLTLDLLKEFGRNLEPAGSASASSDVDGTTAVQFVHDIPRPSRAQPPGSAQGGSRENAQLGFSSIAD